MLILVVFCQVTAFGNSSPWYDYSWKCREKITIAYTKVIDDLTNFPLLITEANLSGSFWKYAQSDGGDIVVTAADGITVLDRELVKIDTSGQTIQLWVRIPTVYYTKDTVLYLYYGNTTISKNNSTSVWTNYPVVYHTEETAGNLIDSGSSGNDGTAVGAGITYEVDMQVDDGVGETTPSYFTAGNVASLQLIDSFTGSYWLKSVQEPAPDHAGIIGKFGPSSPYAGWELGVKSSAGSWYQYFHVGGGFGDNTSYSSTVFGSAGDGENHYVTGAFSTLTTWQADNCPAIVIDGGVSGRLVENIVYDSVTEKYWWIFRDGNTGTVGVRLASADSLSTDPCDWTIQAGLVVTSGTAPYIAQFGDDWYIYFQYDYKIYVVTSSSVNTDYGSWIRVLSEGVGADGWCDFRVDEPAVIYHEGDYYMWFMGEDETGGYEKIGVAVCSTPTGTFTLLNNDEPVLTGSSFAGNWNSGKDRAADPYVWTMDGKWYVGVTACQTDKTDWDIGYFETTDFIHYRSVSDLNPILRRGSAGSWDDDRLVRGGILLDDGTYYVSYTGRRSGTSYSGGLTTITFAETNDWSRLYIDGVLETKKLLAAASEYNTTADFYVGRGYKFVEADYEDSVDEVRLCSEALSTAVIEAKFQNQSDPNTFYSAGVVGRAQKLRPRVQSGHRRLRSRYK